MSANAMEAVSSSLQERSYDQIASILDVCELEVLANAEGFWRGSLLLLEGHASITPRSNAPLLTPQSANPRVLEDWPHALHLLGHIFNKNL